VGQAVAMGRQRRGARGPLQWHWLTRDPRVTDAADKEAPQRFYENLPIAMANLARLLRLWLGKSPKPFAYRVARSPGLTGLQRILKL